MLSENKSLTLSMTLVCKYLYGKVRNLYVSLMLFEISLLTTYVGEMLDFPLLLTLMVRGGGTMCPHFLQKAISP